MAKTTSSATDQTTLADDDEFGQFNAVGEDSDGAMLLDLSDVNENVQREILPPGTYDAVISSCEHGISNNSGNEMWTLQLDVTDPTGGSSRKLYYYATITRDSLPRFKQLLVRVAPDIDLTHLHKVNDAERMVGRACQVKVKNRKYQDEMRNNVTEILPPSSGDPMAFMR